MIHIVQKLLCINYARISFLVLIILFIHLAWWRPILLLLESFDVSLRESDDGSIIVFKASHFFVFFESLLQLLQLNF